LRTCYPKNLDATPTVKRRIRIQGGPNNSQGAGAPSLEAPQRMSDYVHRIRIARWAKGAVGD